MEWEKYVNDIMIPKTCISLVFPFRGGFVFWIPKLGLCDRDEAVE